jgi:hypothetical protein
MEHISNDYVYYYPPMQAAQGEENANVDAMYHPAYSYYANPHLYAAGGVGASSVDPNEATDYEIYNNEFYSMYYYPGYPIPSGLEAPEGIEIPSDGKPIDPAVAEQYKEYYSNAYAYYEQS